MSGWRLINSFQISEVQPSDWRTGILVNIGHVIWVDTHHCLLCTRQCASHVIPYDPHFSGKWPPQVTQVGNWQTWEAQPRQWSPACSASTHNRRAACVLQGASPRLDSVVDPGGLGPGLSTHVQVRERAGTWTGWVDTHTLFLVCYYSLLFNKWPPGVILKKKFRSDLGGNPSCTKYNLQSMGFLLYETICNFRHMEIRYLS